MAGDQPAAGSFLRHVAALGGMFLLLGFAAGSWISRIPAIQAQLGLGNGELGVALVGLPVGSVGAALALPPLIARWGSRRVVTGSALMVAAALALPGFATDRVSFALTLVALGAATGALDVAANTHGVDVERRHGKSVFGRLHALWSLGGFLAALVGAAVQRGGIGPRGHLATVAVGIAVLGFGASRCLGESESTAPRQGRRWSADRSVLALAAVCVAAFVIEVLAADWGGVFIRRSLHGPAVVAAGAFGAFALPHFLVRAFGDPLVNRMPAHRLFALTLATAILGLVVLVAAPSAAIALVGLVLTGAGIGLVVPVGFAAAGRVTGVPPGVGVATAAGSSYLAWCVTPPLVGGLSTAVGLRAALALGPVLGALALLVVRRVDSV